MACSNHTCFLLTSYVLTVVYTCKHVFHFHKTFNSWLRTYIYIILTVSTVVDSLSNFVPSYWVHELGLHILYARVCLQLCSKFVMLCGCLGIDGRRAIARAQRLTQRGGNWSWSTRSNLLLTTTNRDGRLPTGSTNFEHDGCWDCSR